MQEEREEKLIKLLIDRLEPYIKGQRDAFVESARSESKRLCQAGMSFHFHGRVSFSEIE